ncbi:nuclease [Penicillium argentinense]|uniref:Nuclease n=1 Tax=Penicillium argentinense TaxID=1131581 RepID=A0A9W9G217_9EURO|nr:nuclease [Penicillium argentinense]KAJ5110633.1 nuclease [Penicillium argentinense]
MPRPASTLQILTQATDLGPVDHAGIFKYASTGPVIDDLRTDALVGTYDRRMRSPLWIAEHITAESMAQSVAKRKETISPKIETSRKTLAPRWMTTSTPAMTRVTRQPAANCSWSPKAMDETFKMTNMCPQIGEGYNRHYWAKFEDFCRNLTTRVHYEVIGKGAPNVAVPTLFFKIIYAEDEIEDSLGPVAVGAYVLPNAAIHKDTLLSSFEVDISNIEKASGLKFAKSFENRKKLCEEITCDVRVRDFREDMKAKL